MPGFFESLGNLFGGAPEKHKRIPSLLKNQIPLQQQLAEAGMRPGAGGAFGTSADYFRNLLSDNPADFESFAAPEMRKFNEDIIPGLAEQFAGMGSGGLSSSGFRNAAVGAGADLAERLGAIRAQLRQQGAQGLFNIGQQGLQNYSQDVITQPGTQGLLGPAIGALGSSIFGPVGGAIGSMGANYLTNAFGGNRVGANSSPYGNQGFNAAQQGVRRF